MALKSLNKECSVEILMKEAKEANFTKNGEMFDGIIALNIFLNYM